MRRPAGRSLTRCDRSEPNNPPIRRPPTIKPIQARPVQKKTSEQADERADSRAGERHSPPRHPAGNTLDEAEVRADDLGGLQQMCA